jgi:hypothetical protein
LALVGSILVIRGLVSRRVREAAPERPRRPTVESYVPAQTYDPWAGRRPSRRPAAALDAFEKPASDLLRKLSLSEQQIEQVVSQAQVLTYPRDDVPLFASFMEAVFALASRHSPDALRDPSNKPSIEDAIKNALGDDVTDVQLIWPGEGEPFDDKRHRTFPMPPPGRLRRIAGLERCGFGWSGGAAPAWVSLQRL